MAAFSLAQAKCPAGRECLLILTAAKNIEAGAVLSSADISTSELYHPNIEADCFIYSSDKDIERVAGARALVNIPQGAQLKKNTLSKREPGDTPKKIPAQWRAFWFETDADTYDMLNPLTTRVDILMGMNAKIRGAKETNIAATLLQRIAVERKAESNGKYYLLLILDPRDAQYLELTQEAATLKLLLRREDDSSVKAMPLSSEDK